MRKILEIQLDDEDRKRGTFLAYAYLLIYYLRPQEQIPGLNKIPFPGILFLLFTLWGIIHLRGYLFQRPVVFTLLLGVVLVLSGIGTSNVYPLKVGFKYIVQFFPQCVALYLIFDNNKRIENLISLWVVIFLFASLITIKNGGLGPGDFTRDPNDASLALSMGLPLVFYSLWQPGISKKVKLFRLGVMAVVVAAIAITGSRGGFLGLLSVIMGIWWFSKKRIRNMLLGVVAVVFLSGVAVAILPAGYFEEMQSINDPNDGTRVQRLQLWETAWIMYTDHIVLGVGAGNFKFNAGEYQKMTSWWDGTGITFQGKEVHSFYFQVLSELGTVGVLLFSWAVFYIPLRLYFSRSKMPLESDREIFAKALVHAQLCSMGAMLVSGAFISVAYYPHVPLWITMYAIYSRYDSSLNDSNMDESTKKVRP